MSDSFVDFYAKCTVCGRVFPNNLAYIKSKGDEFGPKGWGYKEVVRFVCPYCQTDTKLEYVEILNCELEDYLMRSEEIMRANPSCFPCPYARIAANDGTIDVKKMYCTLKNRLVTENDREPCDQHHGDGVTIGIKQVGEGEYDYYITSRQKPKK